MPEKRFQKCRLGVSTTASGSIFRALAPVVLQQFSNGDGPLRWTPSRERPMVSAFVAKRPGSLLLSILSQLSVSTDRGSSPVRGSYPVHGSSNEESSEAGNDAARTAVASMMLDSAMDGWCAEMGPCASREVGRSRESEPVSERILSFQEHLNSTRSLFQGRNSFDLGSCDHQIWSSC